MCLTSFCEELKNKMEYFFNTFFYQNGRTKVLIETKFVNQTQFSIFNQFSIFSPDGLPHSNAGGCLGHSELRVENSLSPPYHEVEWEFLMIIQFPSCQSLLGDKGNDTWSEDNMYFELRIFPEEGGIVQIWWLLAGGIHILRYRTRENLLNHFLSSLLVGSD